MTRSLCHIVGAADAGARLDALMAERGLYPSRSAAARAIEEGAVFVNGANVAKKHAVAAGGGYQQVRTLRHVLAGHVAEVGRRQRSGGSPGSEGGELAGAEVGDRAHGTLLEAVDERASQVARAQRIGQQAVHGPHGPLQRELPHDERALGQTRVHLPRGREQAHRDGQVEPRPRLAQGTGRQVHHHPLVRHGEAAGPQGGAHALARLLHGGVGHPDDAERGHAAAHDHLHVHRHGLHPAQRRALHGKAPEHAAHPAENAPIWCRMNARSGGTTTIDTTSKRTGTSTTS